MTARVDPFSLEGITPTTAPARRGADHVVDWLLAQGVRLAFGVSGGAVAHLWHALSHAPGLRVVHTAHESGAAFAAAEASLESGEVVAVFTTTGPGLTNALTGLAAARQEGARVVLLSAATPAARRGRGATQDTHGGAPIPGLYEPGPLFHEACLVTSGAMLAPALQRAAEALARPGGAVVHLGLPSDVQSEPCLGPLPGSARVAPLRADPSVVHTLAELCGRRGVVVVGFGARDAAAEVRALVERTGWTAVSTPRGKGILPERHPRCAGVLGFAGHETAEAALAERPEVVLALGTRLGEASSGWTEALRPSRLLVHVGADGELTSGPYPTAPVLDVRLPVATLLADLLERLRAAPPVPLLPPPPDAAPRPHGPVRPSALVAAVQRVVIEESDALVCAESGNAFAWALHHLRLDAPRLRVSVGWGSMGHFACGAIGPAVAGRRTVALVGDGAMLMGHELATAVRDGLPVTWIVLNDGQYGMCRHGNEGQGLLGAATALAPVDFAALAEAMGARAEVVAEERALDGALRRALRHAGPTVIDARIDREERAPIGRRLRSLSWHVPAEVA